jgi:DNA-binding transcriptional regulator YiaG
MSLTELVTKLAVKRQQQEIERQRQEIDELRSELAWRKRSRRELEEGAARKLALGINLNRFETAAYLRISTRTLQRWEDQGRITRCPGYGTSVIYAARDVLRLASASSRKGA